MFTIQPLDPKVYRSKTRKATLVMMGIFVVIGLLFARLFLHWFGEYSNSPMTLNFLGGGLGLLVTAMVMKVYFWEKPLMAEAVYGWKLKRTTMQIYNQHSRLMQAVAAGDTQAMQIMRYYHLALMQMHELEGNSHALIELNVEMRELAETMESLGLELQQTSFDESSLEPYKASSSA